MTVSAKTNPWAIYRTDPLLEKQGVWVEVPLTDDLNLRFKLARPGGRNTSWKVALRARLAELNGKTTEDDEAGFNHIFVETCVLNWHHPELEEGFMPDETGAPMEFSPDAAQLFFEALPDVLDMLVAKANQRATFSPAQVRADSEK